jgi:IPT/TIG domain-containing protein
MTRKKNNKMSTTSLVNLHSGFLIRQCVLFLVICMVSVSFANAQAPSSIQQASNSDITSKTYTSFTAIFASPTTGGNAVVIGVTYGNANPTITTTDTQGDTFLPAIQTWDSRHDQGSAILYAVNIVGGATKVTVQFSSPVAYLALGVHEYSGIAALDVVAGQIGRASSRLSSGAATSTANNDLIFGTGVEDAIGHGDTLTPGTGFTERVALGNAAAYADEDLLQNSAGLIAATWTLSPASDWIAAMAAFKPAGTIGNQVPMIASESPASGPPGTTVTITGTNFGATQGTSTVSFNGTAATPTSWSVTSIVAPVPTGATTGNVVVTVGGQASTGISFTVTIPAPSITSLLPTSGAIGTTVTIGGANFGATQGTSTVKFNGTAATPTSWSATSIVAPVSTGATTGNVVVTVGGQASTGISFTVSTGGGGGIPSSLGWYQVPNTAISSICPTYPEIQAIEGCTAIMADWSGALFDSKRNRLINPWRRS